MFNPEPAPGFVRCRLRAAYDGTAYHGWARLRGGTQLTVAGVLDSALSLVLGCDVLAQGASRTDTGVHARGQAAHFDIPAEVARARPDNWREQWEAEVNGRLPADVRVRAVGDAPEGFHATLSASGKTYSYRLHVGAEPPDPMGRLYRHRIPPTWVQDLGGDLGRLREAASRFCGQRDFAHFAKEDAGRANRSTLRTIHSIDVVDEGHGQCRIDVTLDGALWNMVRNVVGCLVTAACGKLPLDAIDELLAPGGERPAVAFQCFPAEGLCLERVHYAGDDF